MHLLALMKEAMNLSAASCMPTTSHVLAIGDVLPVGPILLLEGLVEGAHILNEFLYLIFGGLQRFSGEVLLVCNIQTFLDQTMHLVIAPPTMTIGHDLTATSDMFALLVDPFVGPAGP